LHFRPVFGDFANLVSYERKIVNPFRLMYRHPLATALTGVGMIGGCILSYEMFPDANHSPKETVVEDAMMYIGMPLAIIGGGITAFRSRRKTTRVFGGLVGAAVCILASLTFATYHDRMR